MNSFAVRRAFAVVLVALACPGCAQAVPLEVYGGLPRLEDVSISPDGTKIAFVRTEGDDRIIAIVAHADRKTLKLLRVGKLKLRSVAWADDFRVMITTSETTLPWGLIGEDREWFQLAIVDLRKAGLVQVPRLVPAGDGTDLINAIDGEVMIRTIEGHTVLFAPGVCVSQRTFPCLVRYDLDTDRQLVVRRGNASFDGWLVDTHGRIIAEQDYDEEDGRWKIRVARDGSLAEVASGRELIDAPRILGYGPTGDALLTQFTEDGQTVWKLLSLRDGNFDPLVEGRLLSRPIEDPHAHRMIGGVQFVDDEIRYVFFDQAKKTSWNSIVNAYGGDHVRFVSASTDFRKVVVLVEGPKMGYQYQLVDLDQGRTTPIGDVYDGIDAPLEVRRVVYPAADGLQIPGYLTLPRGREPVQLPLIVLPHGGPAVMDTRQFDWWSQALADQGYAVLRANYRGSTLNARFMAKGYGEFGRKMQTDLSDGVRYLVREGIADPARVCIVGASYGGYAALAGVALDPGAYRCAASVSGISDLRAFLSWVDRKHLSSPSREQRFWDRFLGVQNRKDAKLDEISPIRHIEAIRVPVLLVHGKDDTVVPYDQSDALYDALRAAHKQVEFVKLKDEDHWLSRGATRLQMLQAVVGFLRRTNPPD